MTADMSAKSVASTVAKAATSAHRLPHAKIAPHRSATRGHSDHGWLNTYHSFSFADWYNPKYNGFGSLRVLNEDRVQPQTGFPTHPHRDFEIFSYGISGQLTHRDSLVKKGHEDGVNADQFYRVSRGDVQFTTGGTGIAHSEFNEHTSEPVHFLQIWAVPWKRGLPPIYHTAHFSDASKREAAAQRGEFVPILSPLAAGVDATKAQEAEAKPKLPGTIPIHADFGMGATLLEPQMTAAWTVGLGQPGVVTEANKRKVFVHLPMTHKYKKGAGSARIRLDGRDDAILEEGDGAFVDLVHAGDKLTVESIGTAEAEVIVLDTA